MSLPSKVLVTTLPQKCDHFYSQAVASFLVKFLKPNRISSNFRYFIYFREKSRNIILRKRLKLLHLPLKSIQLIFISFLWIKFYTKRNFLFRLTEEELV